MATTLETLIRRSEQLYAGIRDALASSAVVDHPRARLAAAYADISLEHGASFHMLVASEHRSSAIALQRVQLDTIVRSLWILYAASDAKVEALFAAVQKGVLKEPNNMPAIAEMIEKISELGPDGVGRSLSQLKGPSWGPLSSFVHGGIFTLHERFRELPDAWVIDPLRNTNGLSLMAATTIADSMQSPEVMDAVRKLRFNFLDCCPPISPSA